MLAKWKASFKVSLYWICTALHEPRAIGVLVPEQISDPSNVNLACDGDARLMQRVQGHSRRIRVRCQAVQLRPSAVRLLSPHHVFHSQSDGLARGLGPD